MHWKIDWKSFLGDRQIKQRLAGIFAIGIILRLLFLWSRSIWFDEAASLFVAQQGYLQIVQTLGTIDFHPPLYYLLLHTWMIPSSSIPWVELFSVIVGMVAIFVLYRFGTVFYNHRVGLYAAFFMAIACLQVRYSQEIRMYSLAVLFVLLSNYYFAKVAKEERFREGYSTWAKYILVTACSLYIHYYAIFNVLVQNLYLLFRYRDNKLRKLWLSAQAITAMLFLPWLPMLWNQFLSLQQEYWIPRPSLKSLASAFIYLGDNIFGIALLSIFSLGGLFSIYRFRTKLGWRSEKRNIFLVLLIVIPMLCAFVLSLVTQSVFMERYFILFAPPLYLLAGKGFSHLSNRFIKWVGLALIVGAMSLCLVPFYHSADTDIKDAVQYIETHNIAGDLVLHIHPATYLPFQAYGDETEEMSGEEERKSGEYLLSAKPLPTYVGGNYYSEKVYLKSIPEVFALNPSTVFVIDYEEQNAKVERALQGISEKSQQKKFGKVIITQYVPEALYG